MDTSVGTPNIPLGIVDQRFKVYYKTQHVALQQYLSIYYRLEKVAKFCEE